MAGAEGLIRGDWEARNEANKTASIARTHRANTCFVQLPLDGCVGSWKYGYHAGHTVQSDEGSEVFMFVISFYSVCLFAASFNVIHLRVAPNGINCSFTLFAPGSVLSPVCYLTRSISPVYLLIAFSTSKYPFCFVSFSVSRSFARIYRSLPTVARQFVFVFVFLVDFRCSL